MMKARLLLLSLLTMAVSLVVHAQTNDTEEIVSIVRTEYFYDTDPGYGKAIIINNVTEDENNLTLSVDGLSPGAHTLYVRSQASNGVWSATLAHPFFLLGPRADHVGRLEYFFDNDPGHGKGHVIDNVVEGDNALPLSLAGLTMGTHTLFLRAQDESGVWSSVTSHPFFIVSAKSANLSCVEYFFDNDPGYGKATAIGGELKDSTTYALSLDNLAPGAHTLYLRAQDNYGRWSAVQSHPIYVMNNLPDVVAVEYFFDDDDPGEGQATAVPLPSVKTDPFAFEVNTEGLPAGEHHLMVRLQNNRGLWTLFDAATFTVEAPEGLGGICVDLVDNGDMEGEDNSNFFFRHLPTSYDVYPVAIKDNVGRDDSRGIKVEAPDKVDYRYDSELWFRMNQPVSEGTKFKMSFDYRADQESSVFLASHGPAFFGDFIAEWIDPYIYPTDEWKTYTLEGVITSNVSSDQKPFASLSFSLNEYANANNYYFDNFKFEVFLEDRCPKPTFIMSDRAVSIQSPFNATIYYTTDGSEPTVNSTVYSAPVQFTQDAIIKAIAVVEGYETSPVATYLLSMGDANGDGDVNIADAVVTVTSILGLPLEGNFYKNLADMNYDDEIDIFDVSMIVNTVLNANAPALALTRGNIESVPTEAVKLTADVHHIYLDVGQAQQYTAFQFDMSLPEGTELVGVKLAGMTNHQLSFVQRGKNEYRVIGLSMSNEVLRSADGHLLELQLSKTAVEDNVKISNVLFVTPAAKTVTGIGECLNSNDVNDGDIYNLKGEKLGLSRQQPGKGIYIMNHKKVIVK